VSVLKHWLEKPVEIQVGTALTGYFAAAHKAWREADEEKRHEYEPEFRNALSEVLDKVFEKLGAHVKVGDHKDEKGYRIFGDILPSPPKSGKIYVELAMHSARRAEIPICMMRLSVSTAGKAIVHRLVDYSHRERELQGPRAIETIANLPRELSAEYRTRYRPAR
jgi:hypothetical protein